MAGRLQYKVITFTGDSSYATGGYALAAADVGMNSILFVQFSDAAGYNAVYDYSTGKIKLNVTGAAANAVLNEVPNATNVSSVAFRVLIFGT